jgi:hypothetical protein
MIVLAMLICCSAVAGPLPNATLTPGVTNPDVTQENIHATICVSRWTDTVRPPSSYTSGLKKKQIAQYHYRDKNMSSYEEDHFIPLELGGHPRDAHNLWPQQYHIRCGARIKDVIEGKLKRLVCNGDLTLAAARKAIKDDWVAAYKEHIDSGGCPPLEHEQ